MWRDRLERVLAAGYLDGLEARSLDELRSMRDECKTAGDDLSYLRRLVQGRFDIVKWEIKRREEGHGPSSTEDLVESLSQVLSDNVHATAHQHMVDGVLPADIDELTDELEAFAPPVWSLPDLDDDELRARADQLDERENEYSQLRRQVFARHDAIKAVITERLAAASEVGSG